MNRKPFVVCIAAFLLVIAVAGWAANGVAKGIHPIVADSFLVGGTRNGKWMSDRQMKPFIRGGEHYRLYNLTRCMGEGIGGNVRVEAPGDTHYLDVTHIPKNSGNVIAISGNWNALPRMPKILSTDRKIYREAIAAVLKKKGLSGAPINITQILRIDLEGDGRAEVLISATTSKRPYPGVSSRKGDYSVVLLRRIVGDRVVTIILDGNFYPRTGTFDAPNIYSISGVLDVDGDGAMEVLVGWHYYEGQGIDIFKVHGEKAARVLTGASGA